MTENQQKLNEAWAKAWETGGEVVSIGRIVVCDWCFEDYTDSPECGGMLFGSNAICPVCTRARMAELKATGEDRYIKAVPAAGESFGDFTRRMRGGDGDGTIKITYMDGVEP